MSDYLDRILHDYAETDMYPFHMPGHKRRMLSDDPPEKIDITEIDGFDDLHHAEGILSEAQQRAARIAGADRSYLLVNGSTCGLLAAVSAACPVRGRILMARNCHKAVYHAAFLRNLSVEYLYPQVTGAGIQGSIRPEDVLHALQKADAVHQPFDAVIVTSPTYDGVISDIRSLADMVHRFRIPLIVDEAHGAHFGLSPMQPEKACACGADYVVESLHKTLPALTQCAVLHVADSEYTETELLAFYLQIYQSSSPSYVLMASMDRCMRILKESGSALFAQYERRIEDCYRSLNDLVNIRVLCQPGTKDPGIWQKDESKILLSAQSAGITGAELYQKLRSDFHLQPEMASGHYVTLLTSIMDTQEGFDRLVRALQKIDRELHADDAASGILTDRDIYQQNEKVYEITQAKLMKSVPVPLGQAAGKISADFLLLYPPGIPLLVPGERIRVTMVEQIETCRAQGLMVVIPGSSGNAETIRVLETEL